MKTPLTKSSKLRQVCYDIRGPVLEKADELIANGERILKLHIGNPAPFGMYSENILLDTMREKLHAAQGYGDARGVLSSREAIFAENQKNGFQDAHIDDIYLGNGVSELILMVMQALLDDGDEALIPMPDYPLWTASAYLSGGKAVHYLCDETENWQPDLDDIRRKITPRTKSITLINPNNPTGCVYDEATLCGIAQIAREHNLVVLCDEIYDKILYDDAKHIPFASLQDDVLCITFNGLSKSYRLAGYRSGWISISGDKSHAEDYLTGLHMLASMRLCANVPAQYIVATALNQDNSIYDLTLPTGRLGEQRDIACNMLNDIDGLSCVKPQGAIYLFAKIDPKFNIQDDEKMMLDLVTQEKMLLVQGTAFNWHTPDHFRIVFLPNRDDLTDAMTRLSRFMQDYRQ